MAQALEDLEEGPSTVTVEIGTANPNAFRLVEEFASVSLKDGQQGQIVVGLPSRQYFEFRCKGKPTHTFTVPLQEIMHKIGWEPAEEAK